MDPAQVLEHIVLKGLHTQTEPVDPLTQIAFHLLIRKSCRVAFYGDLRVLYNIKVLTQSIHDFSHIPCGHQRRRPSSYVHRIHIAETPVLGTDPDFPDQCLRIL